MEGLPPRIMGLQQFQLDVAARLEAAAFFAKCTGLWSSVPRAALTAVQIQDKINAALGTLTAQNSKAGLCATVLMPQLTTQKQELPGPYLHLKCIIQVQENVIVNMGADGTQIACRRRRHCGRPDPAFMDARGDRRHCARRAGNDYAKYHFRRGKSLTTCCWRANWTSNACQTRRNHFCWPMTAPVSIACADPTAAIYYTTDGSPPWAGGNATYPQQCDTIQCSFRRPPAGDAGPRRRIYNRKTGGPT